MQIFKLNIYPSPVKAIVDGWMQSIAEAQTSIVSLAYFIYSACTCIQCAYVAIYKQLVFPQVY